VGALRRCFDALSGLYTATAFDHSSLSQSALRALDLFRSQAVAAVDAAAAEWNGWDLTDASAGSRLDAVASGSRVAAPLTLLATVAARHLLELRDSQLLACFAKAQPSLSNAASSGIMATYVFCEVFFAKIFDPFGFQLICAWSQELSTALADLGRALRDIRSKETPVGEL
jgi:hypothetical protein